MDASIGLQFITPEEEMDFCISVLEHASAQYFMELTEEVKCYLECTSSESSMFIAVTEAEQTFLEKLKEIFKRFMDALSTFVKRTKANIAKYQEDKELSNKIKMLDDLITRGKGQQIACKHFKDYEPKRAMIRREKEDFLKFLRGEPSPEKIKDRIKEFWSKLSVDSKIKAATSVGFPVTVAAVRGFVKAFQEDAAAKYKGDNPESLKEARDILNKTAEKYIYKKTKAVMESTSKDDLDDFSEEEFLQMSSEVLRYMMDLEEEDIKTTIKMQEQICDVVDKAIYEANDSLLNATIQNSMMKGGI